MKKTILKSITAVIVFVFSVLIFASIDVNNNTAVAMEMPGATLPVVYLYHGSWRINPLHGYTSTMRLSLMRESITPLEAGRALKFRVRDFDGSVRGISYEVRDIADSRLIEEGIVNIADKGNGLTDVSLVLKDIIDEDKEYAFIIKIKLKDGRSASYYTRIIYTFDYMTDKKLNDVMDFHLRTFDKSAAASLAQYLEPDITGDNTTFSKVTIHSSFDQITWGSLNVKKLDEPLLTIKELQKETAVIVLDYRVTVGEEQDAHIYRVKEYFKLRTTAQRTFLLDYERTMSQFPSDPGDLINDERISIGIADPDIERMESTDGNNLAFCIENSLYLINVTANKLALLYSFYDKDNDDERTRYDRHRIKILSVDEAANVYFAVYGYFNRGRHEGECGILVMRYDSRVNTVEESLFIPYDQPFEILDGQLFQLLFLSRGQSLYFLLDRSLVRIELKTKYITVVAGSLTDNSYCISENRRMAAYLSGASAYGASDRIYLTDLNTSDTLTIMAEAGTVLLPLGFMEEDFIYGVAYATDLVLEGQGRVTPPMFIVRVVNERGEILTEYKKDGIYCLEATVSGNQINLKRVVKEEDGSFSKTTDDQILNNQNETVYKNNVEAVAIKTYEKIVRIVLKSAVIDSQTQILTPLEKMFDGKRMVDVGEKDELFDYYVTGMKGLLGVYTNPANAINAGVLAGGVVTDENGNYVWLSGNRLTRNQIMAITGQEPSETRTPLAVCLDAILEFNKKESGTQALLNKKMGAKEILANKAPELKVLELTGCSLSAVLYFVSNERPVLAYMGNGEYVLIVGYNEANIVIMNPLTGTVYKRGMNDSKEAFLNVGNRFVAYY